MLDKEPTDHDSSLQNETQTLPSGVITTPTKNRFDVLDTESELNRAFSNLQRADMSKSLALIPILEVPEESHSDGSGTPSKSSIGVPMPNSANNSDEDMKIDDMQSTSLAKNKSN